MEQLDDGGILVLPVGEQAQTLKRIQRHGNEFVVDAVEAVRFVPLVKGELACDCLIFRPSAKSVALSSRRIRFSRSNQANFH